MMDVNASQMALWDAIHSPPWEQERKWVLDGFRS